jgi:hypothetical protein
MSQTRSFAVSQFAGTVSEDQNYPDTPARAVAFYRGERFVVTPGVTKQSPVPQRDPIKETPTFFHYASYAGAPIVGEVSNQLKVWFPGVGLISMQVAQVANGLLSENGLQILAENGSPILLD